MTLYEMTLEVSREIKFRAWDGEKLTQGFSFERWQGMMSVRGLELMQYTGLKDKNGVEIYEGDIVRQGLTRGTRVVAAETKTVEWGSSAADDIGHAYGWDLWPNGELEVIGNVWESPGLLGGTE